MNLQIKIVLISFIVSILTAFIVLPILKKFKVGQIEREYGPRSHLIKQGTPTMGGIIISLTIAIMTGVLYTSNKELLPLCLIIIGFGAVGFVDDFKKLVLKDTEGLKPTYKILRTSCGFSYICFIFNKIRNWGRYYNSNFKNRNNATSFDFYSICNSSPACWNKCGKFN